MRSMGLDVGTKTIGVALSDPLGWTAQGLEVVRRTSLERDMQRLKEIISSYEVGQIIIGMPRNMDGSYGPKALEIQEFAGVVEDKTGLPIIFQDERLSTVAAQRTLIEADVSRSKRKKVIDKMAAVVILQGYLDRR